MHHGSVGSGCTGFKDDALNVRPCVGPEPGMATFVEYDARVLARTYVAGAGEHETILRRMGRGRGRRLRRGAFNAARPLRYKSGRPNFHSHLINTGEKQVSSFTGRGSNPTRGARFHFGRIGGVSFLRSGGRPTLQRVPCGTMRFDPT